MCQHFLFDFCQGFARLPSILRKFAMPLGGAAALTLLLLRVVVPVVTGLGYDHFQDMLVAADGPASYKAWAALLFGLLSLLNAVVGNWAYKHYENWENTRTPKVAEFFGNHHLTRLVG